MNFPIIDVYEHPHYGDSVRYENYVELQEKIEALLASHNALRYNTKVIIKAYRENRTRHHALVEAVKWERECRTADVDWWLDVHASAIDELGDSLTAARAEVDRLIAEGEG